MAIMNFEGLPTTRYQGSKRKILPWIFDSLKGLEFESVLDGFGGSGIVSYMFKRMGKEVTFNDKLRFNYLSAKAIVENDDVIFTNEDVETLLAHDISPAQGIIERNFKDVYFLESENKWLDKVVLGIQNMNHYAGGILEYKKAIAYYGLFQSSLIKRPFNLFHRKNLSIRIADVNRTFGNKATWDKPFTDHFKKFVLEVNQAVFNSGKQCKAINASIFDLPGCQYDLVYLDPPYLSKKGKNETADYLSCYHFLEGICNYETWESIIDYQTKNLRLKDTVKSNDFKINNVTKTYDQLFETFHKSIIVLSYKKGGVPSIDTLVRLLKRHKRKVVTKSVPYNYALNKQSQNSIINREVLIIGT